MAQRTPDPATERIGGRMRRRMGAALVIGPVAGAAVGAIGGWIAFGRWSGAMLGAIVAGVVAGTMLGLLWGGYSSLESPDPGREPSDTERPVTDRTDLVREERGDPIPPGEHEGS
jgi:hypothetical protein